MYNEWSLYSPEDTNYTFPCFFKNCDGYFNLKDLKGDYEIFTWVSDGNLQEVNGVIYYYQIPVLVEIGYLKKK